FVPGHGAGAQAGLAGLGEVVGTVGLVDGEEPAPGWAEVSGSTRLGAQLQAPGPAHPGCGDDLRQVDGVVPAVELGECAVGEIEVDADGGPVAAIAGHDLDRGQNVAVGAGPVDQPVVDVVLPRPPRRPGEEGGVERGGPVDLVDGRVPLGLGPELGAVVDATQEPAAAEAVEGDPLRLVLGGPPGDERVLGGTSGGAHVRRDDRERRHAGRPVWMCEVGYPPSTANVMPCTNPASSEARNAIEAAMSST